jgi:PAS domain S-box-containing protein
MTYIYLFTAMLAIAGLVTGVAVYGYDMSLKGVATDVGLVAAILTGSGVIFTKFIKPFFCHVQNVNALVRDISIVVHDLKPNSGFSMRDAIDRIEAKVSLVDRINWAVRQDGPVGIFRCDQQGRNIEVNRTYCRWLGVGADELMGHGWRRFLAGTSSREGYDQEWSSAFQHGREVEFRIDLRTVDGAISQYDVHAYPIPSHSGVVIEYLGVLRPVA